ncbi:MAG: allantoate amidohydrolase [Streptosporangiales bacterium]|nr:allantoate amidohydrolase [Streptosporangiales bacterium]
MATDFAATFDKLADIGCDSPTRGYRRLAWTEEDRAAREWFAGQAKKRKLGYERDRNGNLWAWWGDPADGDALVLGSHLDTVPRGGAYDGALGVVAGFVAVSEAQRRGLKPERPVAVAAFADEEGGRFGIPTFGSRLLVGAIDPSEVLDRTDQEGIRLADALKADGLEPESLGHDKELLDQIGGVVELHVEQGRGLVDLAAPLGVASGIWPHGRWRLTLRGEANHAGTTRLDDRHDPTLVLAEAILAARSAAARLGAVATIGRVHIDPGSINSVPGAVDAWLDARASHDVTLDELVESVAAETRLAGLRNDVSTELVCESRSPEVDFDLDLRIRLKEVLRGHELPTPDVPTAAGHDAGVLASRVPAAALFVRNPTGKSHTPAESASDEDCALGCAVLAELVAEWMCD